MPLPLRVDRGCQTVARKQKQKVLCCSWNILINVAPRPALQLMFAKLCDSGGKKTSKWRTWKKFSVLLNQEGCGSGVEPRLIIGSSLVQFPWSACQSVLEQDTELQTAPDCPPPSVYVWITVRCFGPKLNVIILLHILNQMLLLPKPYQVLTTRSLLGESQSLTARSQSIRLCWCLIRNNGPGTTPK